LEVAVEFTIIGSLLQITVKREKEHEAASFGLIASFSQKRTLALPKEVEHWSLTTLREKLVKIGAKLSAKSLKW
jgi:hypothetical protein